MAVTLGSGFAPYLLQHIKTIAGESTPQYKLDTYGFLNLLNSQSKPEILRLDTPKGHKKTAQVRYKQRWTKDFTDTSKSCDVTNVGTRKEASVELSSTRQFALHIPDETIAKYEEDASRTVMLGNPGTGIMNELLEEIVLAASALLDGVNSDLLTTAVTKIGKNRVTGSTASKTVNFPLDTTNLPLASGLTEILSDYKRNNGSGRPQIVGNGLFNSFAEQQSSKSADQSGFDTRVMFNGVTWYYDNETISALGANQIIVYEPNAIQIVEYLEYTGFKAGAKPGSSVFGVLALPMQSGSEIIPVNFDFQLKYNDCATELTDAYYGTTLTLEKGYNLIISKQCGLFTIPDDAFRGTDVLNGNRGSYRYTITNT